MRIPVQTISASIKVPHRYVVKVSDTTMITRATTRNKIKTHFRRSGLLFITSNNPPLGDRGY